MKVIIVLLIIVTLLVCIVMIKKNSSGGTYMHTSTLGGAAYKGDQIFEAQPKKVFSKQFVAKILKKLEEKLGIDIVAVYKYSNQKEGQRLVHVVDMLVFDKTSTKAQTKRFLFTVKDDEANNQVDIRQEMDISPYSGDLQISADTNTIDPYFQGEAYEDIKDTRLVLARQENMFPEEPILPSRCLADSNNDDCKLEIDKYRQHLDEYKRQINELRETGKYTVNNAVQHLPTKPDDSKPYSFPQPKTFGYLSAQDQKPKDFSGLKHLKPLKDEPFFNSIAAKHSILALQYQ